MRWLKCRYAVITVNHFVFGSSLFPSYVMENLFAEIYYVILLFYFLFSGLTSQSVAVAPQSTCNNCKLLFVTTLFSLKFPNLTNSI